MTTSNRRTFLLSASGVLAAPALLASDIDDAAERQRMRELQGIRRVAMLPLSPAPEPEERAILYATMRAFLDVDIFELPEEPLPVTAYHAAQKRHRAERVLPFVTERLPDNAERIVGITDGDIATSRVTIADWGILGLGDIGGMGCVVSRLRCARSARDVAHGRERLAKVVLHELGHTFGSHHCETKGCLMEDARGSVTTFDELRDFCDLTRIAFAQRRVRVRARAAVSWL